MMATKRNEARAHNDHLATTLTEPDVTDDVVLIWNRGGKIFRDIWRCSNLMLSVNVQSVPGELSGRDENSNRDKRLRPGLNEVDAGYWSACMAGVERTRAACKKSKTPMSGVGKWLDDGEIITQPKGVEGMSKHDATSAIEGSADLTLVLKIANGDGKYSGIARDHLERITGGGSAILGHFTSFDSRPGSN